MLTLFSESSFGGWDSNDCSCFSLPAFLGILVCRPCAASSQSGESQALSSAGFSGFLAVKPSP